MGWRPTDFRQATPKEFRDFYDGWALATGRKRPGVSAHDARILKEMLDDHRHKQTG